MKGILLKVSTLALNGKWLEYDDTHNKHVPWSELEDKGKLQVFLTLTNLSRIIPS